MKLNYFYILLATVGLGLTACEKDFMPKPDASADATFRPYALTATAVSGTPVTKVELSIPSGIQSFVVEASTDSTNFVANRVFADSMVVSGNVSLEGAKFSKVYDQFVGETTYFIRARAYSNIAGKPSSGWNMVKITTPAENLFNTVVSGVTAKGEVTMVWTANKQVTDLKFVNSKGVESLYAISAAESAAGKKVVTNVPVDETYTISLMNGTKVRGTITNLKVEGVAILKSSDELIAAIASAQEGDVLMLQSGVTFVLPSTTLPAGVSFIGAAGAAKPVISFNNNNALTLPAVPAQKVSFENVSLTGEQYLFNQSAAAEVGEISFVDCVISGFSNCPVRLQGGNAVSVGKINFDNCLISNTASSSYAVIHVSGAGPSVLNVSVTNSTLYNLKGALMRLEGTKAGTLQSVNVENITLNNFAGYVFRLNGTQCNAASASFKNSIVGSTSSAVVGAHLVSGLALSVDNVFNTSDFSQGTASNVLNGMNPYSGASTALFVDPANGDFHFKDQGFVGKLTAGDPRWKD